MKQQWGREADAGDWPSERRVWTIAAFFVALASVAAIYVYRYERVWTPLQRFYLAQNTFNPTVTYDKNLSAKDLAADQSKVGAAIGVINANWIPACGDTPEAMAKAIASGSATRPTVTPATRSERNLCRS